MIVSNQFVDQLFQNDHFKRSFEAELTSHHNPSANDISMSQKFEIQTVVEEVSQFMYESFKTTIEKECNFFYESNRLILEEIENLKLTVSDQHIPVTSKKSNHIKTETSTVDKDNQLETSMFFSNEDNGIDMKDVRRNIEQIQNDISLDNQILTNSFQLHTDQNGDKSYIEFQIEEKINASVSGSFHRIELTLEEKFDKYAHQMQQRIEQLKKTIGSIIEAINDKENRKFISGSPQKMSPTKKSPSNGRSSQQKDKPGSFSKKESGITEMQVESPEDSDLGKREENKPNNSIGALNQSINFGRNKIRSFLGFSSKKSVVAE